MINSSFITVERLFKVNDYFEGGMTIIIPIPTKELCLPVIKMGLFGTIIPYFKRLQSATYIIFNSQTNDFYIGSTINVYDRMHMHRFKLKRREHRNKNLQTSFNSTEECLFDVAFIFTRNREEAFDVEQYLLDKFKDTIGITNISFNARLAGLGTKRTAEISKYFSSIRLGKPIHNEESKRRISLAGLGRKLTPETLNKMSMRFKGIPLTEETKRKMAVTRAITGGSRAVPVKINGVEYACIKHASEALNINYSSLTHRILKKVPGYERLEKLNEF